jgi:hypothetical protein
MPRASQEADHFAWQIPACSSSDTDRCQSWRTFLARFFGIGVDDELREATGWATLVVARDN